VQNRRTVRYIKQSLAKEVALTNLEEGQELASSCPETGVFNQSSHHMKTVKYMNQSLAKEGAAEV
jgi:hypothetical protein